VAHFSTYQNRFPNIEIDRDPEGVILVRVQEVDGGPLKWGADPDAVHEQLVESFYQIGRDRDNRVMIFTGSGDNFCTARDPQKFRHIEGLDHSYRMMRGARDLLVNLLEIDATVISAANGPASYHPELLVLGDVVLATPETWFQDSHIRDGVVPADGCQIVWQELLGVTRGNYFLMMQEKLTAQAALGLGVVHEIVSGPELLPRAYAVAKQLLKSSVSTLRYSRVALTQPLKERMARELIGGLTAQFLSSGGKGPQWQ
jgi:enoyl-CoA hydratase/carnithine racemase